MKLRVKKVLLIICLLLAIVKIVFAGLQFDNETTRFVLKNSNSLIRFTPSSILGWQDNSIISSVSNAGLGDYNLLTDAQNPVAQYSNKILNYPGVPNTLLGSNWNIPANTVVHVSNNAVLDGNGNTINLGANSQIFVDDTVTLTLRNVVISNNQNFGGNPPIALATNRSKLVLDNARLNFVNDFYFNQGELFAYNDVNFTGTSSFIYRSTVPSYIMSGANLKFNPKTTFYFEPSTSGTTTLLAKDLLIMGDATSKLTLDGTTLKTTLTGMRLTKGQLLLGNNVTMTSATSFRATGTSAVLNLGGIANAYREIDKLQWSPDGRKLAVAGRTRAVTYSAGVSGNLAVYLFSGTTTTTMSTVDFSVTASGVSWSPDGQYVAAGGKVSLPASLGLSVSTSNLQVYSVVNNSLSPVTQANLGTTLASYAGTVSWSPDGHYLAVGGNMRNLTIYQFNGAALNQVSSATTAEVLGIAWHPSGKYVAIATNSATSSIAIYSVNNGVLGTSALSTRNYASGYGTSVSWSPDGNYLATTGLVSGSGAMYVYSVNSAATSTVQVSALNFGTSARTVKWSPDGRFLLVGGNDIPSRDLVLYIEFPSLNIIKTVSFGTYVYSTDIHPSGLYLTTGGFTPTPATYQTLSIGVLAYGQETTGQAISNSIVFGNSASGSSYDLNLQLLSGANVSVDGIVNYDNVNSTSIFNNDNARFVLKNSNSEIRIGPAVVYGWKDRSLIKNLTGAGLGDFNVKSYGSNNLVTYAQSGGELVYDNSNAIVSLAVTARTNSNAFAYEIKNNSNAIVNLSNNVQVFNTQQVYNHPATIQNFAWYKAGFQVDPGVILALNTPISVNGQISLGGILTLSSDLFLEAGATFTSSYGFGEIYGNGNAVHLGGNLTIPTNNFMHFGTNTIIEGHGNTINLGNNAEIFVDDNVTLTLRNVIVKNSQNFVGNPAIKLASNRSKLTLDNSTLDIIGDFYFNSGQLFVNNDVKFTGTSAFVYRSSMPSFITSGSKLFFDIGTTFSVAPATFTDCPYSIKSTYTTNNFIRMADQTSQIYLNGCSFFTTMTGCRFRTGSLFLGNKVTMNSNSASAINVTVPMVSLGSVGTGTQPQSVSWSPDGRFLAVVNWNGNTLQIFSFSGSGNPTFIGSVGTGAFSGPQSVSWSPDGRFLAVVVNTCTMQIFSFSGSGNPTLIGSVGTGADPNSVIWSPDGRFLAVVNTNDNTLQVFSFNGLGNPTSVGIVGTGGSPQSVSWSPDGRFLAVSNDSGTMQIFSFSGSGNPTFIGSVGTGTSPFSVPWSPDGRFLAVVNYVSGTMQIFSFSGSGNPTLIGSVGTGTHPQSVSWSPDGRFLAVVNYGSFTMQIFSFSGSGNPTLIGSVGTGTQPYSVSWSPDGRFLAVVNYGDNTLQVFGVNYVVDRSTQALSNSIVFGNSALGSSSDLKLQLLSGANVSVDGIVNYDNVNSTSIFSNDNAKIILKNGNSEIKLRPATVLGWQDSSIIANAANAGLGDYNLLSDDQNLDKIINYPGVPNTLLGSNWNIPANTIVHVSNNAVLDGNGNTINLGANSQIFVDDTVTLTLRNVVISNNQNFGGNPPIALATNRSKLVLDNARLNFVNDFYFNQGELFAYNDVNFTGTSSFIYRSTVPSYIMSGANLKFNPKTTFYFEPSTSGTTTLLAKDLLIMGDATSKLTLEGTTLKTTLTGMRLTKGQLLLGNNVTMTSATSFRATGTSAVLNLGGIANAYREIDKLQWSPDGRRLAVAGRTRAVTYSAGVSGNLAVYLFSGTTTTTMSTVDFSVTASGVSWSPDGQYVAAGGKVSLPASLGLSVSTSNLQVYSVVNNSLSPVTQANLGTTLASYAGTVSWSPDGHYLAVGGNMRNLTIYQFNGNSLNQISTATTAEVLGIAWHPSGKYVAIATNSATASIAIYAVNNGVLGVSALSTRNYASGYGTSVSWSPDGNYLATTGLVSGSGAMYVYSVNSAATSTVQVSALNFGTSARTVKWSPDGRFLLVGGNDIPSRDLVLYIEFPSLNIIKTVSFGTYVYSTDIHPSGLYLTTGGFTPTPASYQSLSIAVLAYGQETTGQAISNSIVFGNSASGSSYDLNLQLLSGANVAIDGIVNYDNVNSTSIFNNDNARFVLKNSNSEIRIGPAVVYGWKDRSLIKNLTGAGLGDFNVKSYGSNNLVTYAQSGGELVYDNSNAIVSLAVTARTNSNVFAYEIKNNSNWINQWATTVKQTSNTANYLSIQARTSSNYFARLIRSNSQALTSWAKQTSNWVNQWATTVKQTSNSMNYWAPVIRTTSNWVNQWAATVKQTSNSANYLSTRVRTDSNALLTLNRTTSNALLFGDRNNSNAIIKLGVTERTNSNAFAYGIKNNSNWINQWATTVKQTSNSTNAWVPVIRTTSNWVNQWAATVKQTSNSANWLNTRVRTDSNALLALNRTTSNALLLLNRTTSNALLFGDRNNSNAIIKLGVTERTNSNAFAYGIKNNSNWINQWATTVKQTSNSMNYWAPVVNANSNWINQWAATVKQTSNSANWLNTRVRTDSNALLALNRTTSNALLLLNRTTSNALLFGDRNNSNAIIKLGVTERTNSNAFAYGIKNNSNWINQWATTVKQTSNSMNYWAPVVNANSNWINQWAATVKQTSNSANWLNTRVRTDSNALLALNRTTSNALLLLNRTTSNALLFGDRNNSNAIIKLGVTERTNSNAFAYGIKNNSNWINQWATTVKQTSNSTNAWVPIIRTTSNWVNQWAATVKQTSNSANWLNTRVRTDSNALLALNRTTSNALLLLNRTTSNALLFGDRNNSNAIIKLGVTERTNSNAFAYGIKNNSNWINQWATTVKQTSNSMNYWAPVVNANSNWINQWAATVKQTSNSANWLNTRVRTDSNALLALNRTTSNALLLLNRTTSNALLFGDRNNSNAIIKLGVTERTNSNAFAYGIKNNSNWINQWATTVKQTSNSMNYWAPVVNANSNWINQWAATVKQTSNSANWLNTRVRTDSNALLALNRTTSNALLLLNRTTSNALLFGDRNNSNAIIKLGVTERTNSNAFAYGIKNNSNWINQWATTVKQTSNSMNYWAPVVNANSNWINQWAATVKQTSNSANWLNTRVRTDSNALLALNRTTSNALLLLNRTTSNALLFGDRNNSNAIIKLGVTERTNSNAFAYGIKNNSNAIIKLGQITGGLSIQNSNAIVSWVKQTSNTANWLNIRVNNDSNAINHQATQFISVNNGQLTVLGAINGSTTITGRSILESPINLQGGTLTLGGDIFLSNQTTIQSSGNFSLQGNAMFFGGDITLPANVAITIVSSGVLDGQGNNLSLAPGAILILDAGITLTLRNMNWLAAGSPQIEMRSATSKLTLQNTAICFDRDYSFTQGQLFIQDDVFVTGTNKFSYASTGTSYIASHSTLYLDKNTTFSYSPGLTRHHTLSERNLIKLADQTSELYFDECTLQLLNSGWQLTNGTVFFDNKVTVNGNTTQATSFELGNGLAGGDMNVQLLSGAWLDNMGYIYYNASN